MPFLGEHTLAFYPEQVMNLVILKKSRNTDFSLIF